ncbi:MAG: DUF2249 domain-containing protein [Rubrivivax sp.]|nr:DUF2249 domain-containing protein [Rubrivivax sp.]
MSIAAELIDVRSLPPQTRHPLIFGAFDALQPGEAFDIVSDHDPAQLLIEFQCTRAGQYSWCCHQRGPARWHVRLSRVARGAVTGGGSGACCAAGCTPSGPAPAAGA